MMWFPLIARNKTKEHCAVCNKELIKFRYKPRNEWDIHGILCGDCHVLKTMEYSGNNDSTESKKRHDVVEDEKETSPRCGICNTNVDSNQESLRPKWQWNMESNVILCKRCYSMRSKEHERRINYCAVCGNKMPFFRYNPKPIWQINGQLCRRCWDDSNKQWKKER